MTPTATGSRVREELQETVLPWWQRHGVDREQGGVFTVFDNAGRRTSTDKYTWSQGRWAWLCARLARDAREGLVDLDPEEWSGYATATARFLARHALLPGPVTAHLTSCDGTPIPSNDNGDLAVSVLTDLFAALGLAGAAGLLEPGDDERTQWVDHAHHLLAHATERLAARTAPSEPYPVPPGFTDLAGFMLRLHVGAELHRVDGREESAAVAVDAARDLVAGDRPMWWADGWWEFRPDEAQDEDTLLARHRTPGHLVETAWMLLDAAEQIPEVARLVPSWLPDLVLRALRLGWDGQSGGMLRYVDRDGGEPAGRLLGADRYEELVLDTWDTKLWWVHVEAMLAARRFESAYPKNGFDEWRRRLTAYTLATFPDPDGQEWLQVRDREGHPLDRVVALPVKDPFHIARALLLTTEIESADPPPMTTVPTYALAVSVHPTRHELGAAAGALAAQHLRSALADDRNATVMLAAAPSQAATLAALVEQPDIDWSRVTAFHMDDYLGLDPAAPQGFGTWLERAFVSRAPRVTFHRMSVSGDPETEAAAYAAQLPDGPFDLVLLGLGVNGHLAFNDPPARFDDPRDTRVVELDEVSRRQQVDEGHFATVADVPRQAITVTIPRLLHARHVVASVPGAEKRDAVRATLSAPIGPAHPGTALRTHPDVALFLDAESAPR